MNAVPWQRIPRSLPRSKPVRKSPPIPGADADREYDHGHGRRHGYRDAGPEEQRRIREMNENSRREQDDIDRERYR